MEDSEVIIEGFDEVPEELHEDIYKEYAVIDETYIRLTENHLELKNYFFPSNKPKVIKVSAIETIYYKPQGKTDVFRTKGWGMHGTQVWWAKDLRRGFRTSSKENPFYNVVIDCGERLMKGFTVTNIARFIEQMKVFRPNGLVIKDDKLPGIFHGTY